MSAPAQRSFSSGELAPALYARTDQSKYATGLRTCRNFIVQRHGGVALRPGTKYIGEVKDSSVACRLFKFVLDATDVADTYLMEFGDRYIRFYQDAGRVVVSGVAAWANTTAYAVGDLVSQGGVNYYCTLAHTSANGTNKPGVDAGWPSDWSPLTGTTYEIPTPYATADLADLQIVQMGDVISIVHQSYAPRELRRYGHTDWTLTPITFGPSIDKPANLVKSGGSGAATQYWAVTAVKAVTFEESLAAIVSGAGTPSATSPVVLTWNLVANAVSYNVFRSDDGLTYGLLGSAGGVSSDQSDTAWTDSDETASSAVPGAWVAAAGQCRNPLAAITATNRAFDGNYTVHCRTVLTAGAGPTDKAPARGRVGVYYSRDGETRVLAGYFEVPALTGAGSVSGGNLALPINVPDNGYAALTIDLVPEVYPVAGATCSMNVNTITSPANSVTWSTGVTTFSDVGETPDFSIAPPASASIFDALGSYPSAVMRYQQRQLFGNTVAEPERCWASRIASDKSFTTSTPLQADDMVNFTLVGRQVNAIKHMLDLGHLVIFTTGSVLVIDGNQDGTLTPDSINPRKVARHGIGTLPPLEIDDSAVYVEGRGTIVRSLTPVEAGGAYGGYRGYDLTVFSAHLFDGYTLADWDYAENPQSVLWAVRSDGTLLGLTLMPEHAVWGWHRHDTDGEFENVQVIPEGSEDAVYVVVKRTINGSTVRYIERFTNRHFTDVRDLVLMDAALSYDGWDAVGVITAVLTGGTDWDEEEQLTCTASAPIFAATNVGDGVFLSLGDDYVRCIIESFTSTTVVKVRPDRSVPSSMHGVAVGNGSGEWALAVATVSGLSHLEGEAVAVIGDGFVEASPNNADYDVLTVASGAVALSEPYAIIHVGLPYLGDFETLDLDSPGTRTIKDKKSLVSKVILFVESSRGIFAGKTLPDDSDPLSGLYEFKNRNAVVDESYDDPPELVTDDISVGIDSGWDTNGRIAVRQVDPVPLTILSAATVPYQGA